MIMVLSQMNKQYTVNDKTYDVKVTATPVEDTVFYRTNYHFKFTPEDARVTNFYCFTSENFEIVFRYLIEAYEMFGAEWNKHLKFNFITKQLFLDDQALPV
jgi:hypothetical protein